MYERATSALLEALDGSSQPVLDALNNAGLEILPARRKYMIVTKPVEVQLDCSAWARLEPADQLQIDVKIEYLISTCLEFKSKVILKTF